MPQPVAKAVDAFAIIGLEYFSVVIHIGNIGNRVVTEAVRRQRRRARLDVQSAIETFRKCKLFRIRERLITKHQHTVFIHARAQLLQRGTVMHLAQIYRADFATDVLMQLANGH